LISSDKIGRNMKKVAVGMSGGVDSSLSAALLIEQGYDVTGVFLECWRGPGCRVDEDRRDAMDVALKLKIPFVVLDFKKEYKQKVVDYFYAEYKAGRTPNPDVVCNREIKFGMFYEWAMKHQFDALATGHYARIGKIRNSKFEIRKNIKSQISNLKMTNQNEKIKDEDSIALLQNDGLERHVLMRGVDEKKDQSYFLYQLREEQLGHILFPVGEMMKSEVRQEALARGLVTAGKPDSQGICFIGEVRVDEFLKELGMKEKVGEVLLRMPKGKPFESEKIRNSKSEIGNNIKIQNSKVETVSNFEIRASDLEDEYVVVGWHRGAWFYTVGQRVGRLRMTDDGLQRTYDENLRKAGLEPTKLPPLYVVEKDVEGNRLIVGTREMVMRDEFEVGEVHMINDQDSIASLQNEAGLRVRIRHGGELIEVQKVEEVQKVLKVHLRKPAFGVAPGQAAVFYQDEVCVWGGIIQ
jgi:tRNA-uridine 2-sulfurtransferase